MNEKKIPDIMLERFLLGELDEKAMSEIEEELKKNQQLQKRLDALRESDQEILSTYNPARMASAIQKKGESAGTAGDKTSYNKKKRRNNHPWKFPSIALMGTLGMITVIISLLPENTQKRIGHEIEETRLKGNATKLFIYRKRDNRVEMLADHSSASKNDLIQVGYFTQKELYGTIFSVDGRGSVTLHFPENSAEAKLLVSGQKILLNNSYELDDAPLFEKFFLVTSPEKFDIAKTIGIMQNVMDQQKNAKPGKSALPPDAPAEVISIMLHK